MHTLKQDISIKYKSYSLIFSAANCDQLYPLLVHLKRLCSSVDPGQTALIRAHIVCLYAEICP